MEKKQVIKRLKRLSKIVRKEYPNFLGFIVFGSFVRSEKYNDIDVGVCI